MIKFVKKNPLTTVLLIVFTVLIGVSAYRMFSPQGRADVLAEKRANCLEGYRSVNECRELGVEYRLVSRGE